MGSSPYFIVVALPRPLRRLVVMPDTGIRSRQPRRSGNGARSSATIAYSGGCFSGQ